MRSVYLLIFAILPTFVFAQDRCGTVPYMKSLKGENFSQDKLQFEQWMEQRLRNPKRRNLDRQQAAYQIPVVVHVIHNGEAVGIDKNISDAQILSQISVLNKDFQRLNGDASQTPADFLPLAGSLDVEFVLAKQDPEGLATNGIVRVQGPKTAWSMNDNYLLKSLSYWPAEEYVNIWVCNLTGVLGYAQFPVSGLPGLENSSDNRLTDGIVIAYRAFGSSSEGLGNFNLLTQYNKGRTTTHEMGHFFGLRHIWGDDNGQCDGSDYVSDTPNQDNSSGGCPTHPRITCGTPSMFQNYLDYTNDACMNLFTAQQVGRMMTVLENSPRRASLLSSPGASDPLPVANDLGIRDVISPRTGVCAAVLNPTVEVRNYGSNAVSSTQIELTVDGISVETKNFTFSPLSPLSSIELSFAPIPFISGVHTVDFEIILTNNVTDGKLTDNSMSTDVLIPETTSLPITETFNTIPLDWQILNPDLKTTWQLTVAPSADPNNTAMKMDFYNYEDNLGEIDALVTPVFDLSNEPVALLLFDVAYSRFEDDTDGLKVVVLSNCNADITAGTVVYDKAGAALETRSPTTNEFVPVNENQWRNEFIDLSAFVGQSNLQLAFVGVNDWGNNLYLDNITIATSPLNDVALREVISPGPVLCTNDVAPKIRIYNAGTVISSVKVRITINGKNSVTQTFSDMSVPGGSQTTLDLAPVALSTGVNTIFVELLEPNGLPDVNPSNNTRTTYSVVNDAADIIPIREDFENAFDDQWTIINRSTGMNWAVKTIEDNNTVFFDAYNNNSVGDQSWLVSPALDFSNVSEASLGFDLSYAFRDDAVDEFKVLVSTDCGVTYNDTIFSRSASSLAAGTAHSSSWQPTVTQWQRGLLVNLNAYAGQAGVRLAFVFINGNGNNIYLDNIQIFVSEEPIFSDIAMTVHPNPFYLSKQDDDEEYRLRLTFSLPERGPVSIEMIDIVGRVLFTESSQDILNQTYIFSVPDLASGRYIVRVSTATATYVERVIISK